MSAMFSAEVYQLKITLADRASIWRLVQVTADTTLAKLHHVIQVVMGWKDWPNRSQWGQK